MLNSHKSVLDYIADFERQGIEPSEIAIVFHRQPDNCRILQTLKNIETGDICYLCLKGETA